MKNGHTNIQTLPVEETVTETERLLSITELLREYPTRAELISLKGQMQTMQTTIDRHQDINKELLNENNAKIDEMQKDMGDMKVNNLKVDIILKRITDTFQHMGVLFSQQQKEIGHTVEDSVAKAMQPVQEKVDNLTNKKIENHKPQAKEKSGVFSALKFW